MKGELTLRIFLSAWFFISHGQKSVLSYSNNLDECPDIVDVIDFELCGESRVEQYKVKERSSILDMALKYKAMYNNDKIDLAVNSEAPVLFAVV